ncbi:unnamed protein product [Trichobilharzia regenti]|nr:unnamed protein product [Trichobilharzia regenti]
MEFAPDGTGEWAFKSDTYGFYLSGSDTQVSCFSKSPVWWSVRLATHPQVSCLSTPYMHTSIL